MRNSITFTPGGDPTSVTFDLGRPYTHFSATITTFFLNLNLGQTGTFVATANNGFMVVNRSVSVGRSVLVSENLPVGTTQITLANTIDASGLTVWGNPVVSGG
jgi:hypothetical protein